MAGRLHHWGKPDVSVSASDCEILRRAFIEAVIEEGIPENSLLRT